MEITSPQSNFNLRNMILTNAKRIFHEKNGSKFARFQRIFLFMQIFMISSRVGSQEYRKSLFVFFFFSNFIFSM